MKAVSDVTGIEYEMEDVVFFRNLYQTAFYVSNSATIVDVFADSKGKLVFVFYRNQHETLLKKWIANKKDSVEE